MFVNAVDADVARGDGAAANAKIFLGDFGGDHDHSHEHGDATDRAPLPTRADIPGGTTTTATIGSNGMLYDRIETKGDHDWIKITLTAGQQVTFLLSGFGGDKLVDPYIYLRSSTGALVAENDDKVLGEDRDSRLEFTATTSGTYYIDIGAYAEDYTGDYQLQVFNSRSTTDVITATTATTARIEFGASFNGVLESGADRDWVAITLVAGQDYVFNVSGDGTSPLGNPQLALRSGTGTVLAQNDNTLGLNPQITFRATTTGTYYLDVGSSGGTGTGEYSVDVKAPLQQFSYDQIAIQLLETYWGDGRHYFAVGSDNALTVNLTAITAAGQTLARAALQTWTDVTGIRFVETTGTAEITFQDTESGAFASSRYSGSGIITSATVNVSQQWLTDYGTSLNSYAMQTYIHEVGHALGLGHAGNYNGSAEYALDASYANDAWSTTVMSYFSQRENTFFRDQGFSYAYVATPMNGDVVAMTSLYGLSTTTRTGNTIYGFGSTAGNAIFDASAYSTLAYCIVDSAGIDRLDYSGFGQVQSIDLREERYMNIGSLTGNVMIARGTVIEEAVGGSGSDLIVGNAVNNLLFGGAGNDEMYGCQANDTMYGGVGNDILDGGTENDTLHGEAGVDWLAGGTGNDSLYGGDDADTLIGGAGADLLSGGFGQDRLDGGSENDTLFGGDDNDQLTGGTGNDHLIGGPGADTLLGGDGADVLIGMTGLDRMTGGAGADKFQLTGTVAASNADTITDFEKGLDLIMFDRAFFTALTVGALSADALRSGAEALDADDRILHDIATGAIFYDPDGNGAQAKVQVASIGAGIALSAADFWVYGVASAEPIKIVSSIPAHGGEGPIG